MSKWNKLLERICSLPGDVRFEELKKILESYGDIKCEALPVVVVTTHSENQVVLRLPFQNMNLSRKRTLFW